MSDEHEPSEAQTPTPPRGIPEATPAYEPPQQVWGEERQDPPRRAPEQRRAAIWRAAQVAALVLGLLGVAWFATDYARTTWRTGQPSQPVAVDQSGTASVQGITVSLVEATDLGATPSLPGSDWQPPNGFHAWRVVLETTSTNEEILTCDVMLADGQGRKFYANYFVTSSVDGYQWSYSCGAPSPGDEIPPQQALLVLVPADAEPLTVQVSASILNPDYVELEIP